MCVYVCVFCFISKPYPVYLTEAEAHKQNSLKVKAKGGGGVDECIQMYTTSYNTHTHYIHTLPQPWGAMVTLEL